MGERRDHGGLSCGILRVLRGLWTRPAVLGGLQAPQGWHGNSAREEQNVAGLHADEQGSAVMAETEWVTSSFMEEDLVVGSICQLVTPRSSPVSIRRVAICCDGAICQYAKLRYGVISRYTKRHIPKYKVRTWCSFARASWRVHVAALQNPTDIKGVNWSIGVTPALTSCWGMR